MINESSNSSIPFAESKGATTTENGDPLHGTVASEHSIKFHAEAPSEGEAGPDTNTTTSIQIESENPHSANSHNPRATTKSQEDIHFDVIEEPASSSVQSVRFQVEESRSASCAGSKVNRGASPPPTTEGASIVDFHEETPRAMPPSPPPQQQPAIASPGSAPQQPAPAVAIPAKKVEAKAEAEAEAEVEVKAEAEAEEQPPTQAKPRIDSAGVKEAASPEVVEAPAAAENSVTTYPPPKRVSQRAATAARTPRDTSSIPITPRSRTPQSSYTAQPIPAKNAEAAAPAKADVPPLAPADEAAQAERAAAAAAAAKPQTCAHHPTGTSEFSSMGDPDAPADDAAAAASVATPASPNIVVTDHKKVFAGPAWAAVVETSRDEIERTVGNETAAAAGVETSFVRVTSIEANDDGMTCELSIGHAPAQSTEQIDQAIHDYGYADTLRLLEVASGHGEPVASDGAAVGKKEADKPAPPIPFSFKEKVGEGHIVLNYSVFPFGAHRRLELSFDSPIKAVSIKFVKQCLSEYLGTHESQLVVRRGKKELSDDATGAELGLVNGCTLDAQCTTSQSKGTDAPDPNLAPQPKKGAAKKKAAAATPEEPKKAKTAKKKAKPEASTKKAKTKSAAASDGAATTKKTNAKKKKKTGAAATQKAASAQQESHKSRGLSLTPHYATPTAAYSNAHNGTHNDAHNDTHKDAHNDAYKDAHNDAYNDAPQPSTARFHVKRAPLPRTLTTPRIYHAHSPRPGAESLEEGETMAQYMSASREGTQARSGRPSFSQASFSATAAAEQQSAGRRSSSSAVPPSPSHRVASVIATRRSSATSHARSSEASVPPQHTVRGVTSVAFRPRPVIHAGAGAPQEPRGHQHDFLRNAVEHQADTHSASIRSRSPQQPALDVDNTSSTSVDFVEEEIALEEPVQPQVYAQQEALVHAEVPQPEAVMVPYQGEADPDVAREENEEVNFKEETDKQGSIMSLEYDYGGEPEQHREEDPVPAAAPNPFV